MEKYRAILVDDEELSRKRLRKLLAKINQVELIAEADNPFTCIELIESQIPDLLFLDIQMPGLTGFELLQQIPPRIMPLIVFVTAYDQYALKAFKSLALDYLLKPIKLSNIQKSILKIKFLEHTFRKDLQFNTTTGSYDNPLLSYMRRFVVKEGEKWEIIEDEDISMFFSKEKYCFLRTKGINKIVDFTLQEIEKKIDPTMFIRIHRSTIVAQKHLKSFRSLGSGRQEIVLSDGSKVISSRSYSQYLKNILK